jgi:phosphoribosylaminoimidazole-succinocarboxamide synthase
MEKREEIYSGKAKSVYATDDPKRMIVLQEELKGRRIQVNTLFHTQALGKPYEAG